MAEERLAVNSTERARLHWIEQATAGRCSQAQAATELGLSVRQVKRLVRAFRIGGATAVLNQRRGKTPNNAKPAAVRARALALVHDHYADFGPTLAAEYLRERHNLALAPETLRQWLIADGLWRAKPRRLSPVHQSRTRRPRVGELVQIDGSPHDWFERRGPRCSLIAFIDDATSRVMALRFVQNETTLDYMGVLDHYLHEHGVPLALYSDRHSIFRVNVPGQTHKPTQFTRALHTLDIEPIQASSPQAKGRVERLFLTLQNRLVKALRLANISDIDSANAFVAPYRSQHNAHFARRPFDPEDAHRPLTLSDHALEHVLSLHHTRKLSKSLSFQFEGQSFLITNRGHGYRLQHKTVQVIAHRDGRLDVQYNGESLDYRVLERGEKAPLLADTKQLNTLVDNIARRPQKPASNHPWRTTPINPQTRTPHPA